MNSYDMAKAPKLDNKIYDILHNALCWRLMKNDSNIHTIKKHLLVAMLKNVPDFSNQWNIYKSNYDVFFHTSNKEIGWLYYYVIAADYLIFRLGYRTKLRDDIESLKATNKAYNGEFDWVLDRYEGFKKSYIINYHIKGIETIGIEKYCNIFS